MYPEDAQKNAWDPEAGPAPGQYAQSMNGYQLPIAMEVRRGRYLKSFEKPEALKAGAATVWDFPLRHALLHAYSIIRIYVT